MGREMKRYKKLKDGKIVKKKKMKGTRKGNDA